MATKISPEDVVRGDLTSTKMAYETFEVIVSRDKLSKPSTQYIIMAKAIDDAGNVAQKVSNKARFCNDCIPPEPSNDPNKFSGGEIFGIIVGVFVLAAMIGFVIFAALVYSGVVNKPDIKKPNLKIPKSFKS